MPDERYVRQIMAFSEEGQSRLSTQRIGIVGLGGLGCHLVQAISYLGVSDFVLVEDDLAETSNLNRLIFAAPGDVGLPKLWLAERMIRRVQPDARITAIQLDLCRTTSIQALQGCTCIFGAVDGDGPRLVLMELSAAYSVPYIDCASDILLNESRDKLEDFGGRVVVSRPGDFCLDCAAEIDKEAAKQYFESPEAKQVRRQHGYGLGPEFPAPSVVTLNGIIANLATTEFLVMVTGIREPNRKLTYRGMNGSVKVSTDQRKPGCYICEFLVGRGDAVDVGRYARSERRQGENIRGIE